MAYTDLRIVRFYELTVVDGVAYVDRGVPVICGKVCGTIPMEPFTHLYSGRLTLSSHVEQIGFNPETKRIIMLPDGAEVGIREGAEVVANMLGLREGGSATIRLTDDGPYSVVAHVAVRGGRLVMTQGAELADVQGGDEYPTEGRSLYRVRIVSRWIPELAEGPVSAQAYVEADSDTEAIEIALGAITGDEVAIAGHVLARDEHGETISVIETTVGIASYGVLVDKVCESL